MKPTRKGGGAGARVVGAAGSLAPTEPHRHQRGRHPPRLADHGGRQFIEQFQTTARARVADVEWSEHDDPQWMPHTSRTAPASAVSPTPLTRQISWWALVVSNHRPPPCKGEANALVSGLSRSDRVPLSSFESL